MPSEAAPYLTADEATEKLADRFGITAELFDGDMDAASDALDAMGPFMGHVSDSSQARMFPRWVPFFGGTDQTPEAILDYVALKAYELSTEHEPGVRSEGAGRVNVSYSEPKRSQLERRMAGLLDPYLLKVGRLS